MSYDVVTINSMYKNICPTEFSYTDIQKQIVNGTVV